MIISSSPFRISFAGGGSDVSSFYERSPGAVLSCSINKYSYIAIHSFFDKKKFHLKYSVTELVDGLQKIEHPILREGLKFLSVDSGIEIASIADIPSGTGLGSSSAFTVALLNAIYAFQGKFASKEKLAHESCLIEIEKLNEPIGKQDQYASAYGGFNFIEFKSDGSVQVNPLTLSREFIGEFEKNIMLFYLGDQRNARDILSDQNQQLESDEVKFKAMKKMVLLASDMRMDLVNEDIESFGKSLHEGWMLKKSLSKKISSALIDESYSAALSNGAIGGKLAGAGGAGFLLLCAPQSRQSQIRNALSGLQEMEFKIDWGGAKVVFSEH